jgi:hypothetical protein
MAAHAWQAVSHAVSQQKPSTQKPLAHWDAALHAAPRARPPELELLVELDDAVAPPVPGSAHVPATQMRAPLQSTSEWQGLPALPLTHAGVTPPRRYTAAAMDAARQEIFLTRPIMFTLLGSR